MSNDRGFLGRWSRLKQVDREAKAEQPEIAMEEEAPAAPVPAAADDSERETAPAEADVGDLPDIESLTRDSDYTAFMREGVPEDLRNLALRKLWRSDPVFANLDGLNDYDEDFRMVSMAGEVMKSTWKVGSGYDEPEPDPEVAGEEMEDLDSASAGAGEPDVAPEGEPADEASGEDGMFPDGGKA